MSFKLGRLPRAHSPLIMHMSALFAGRTLPVPPASVDWTKGITDFGMALNDQLGCCTCAGIFHARQIWTANVLIEKTEPDDYILKLYEEACHYNPTDPSTDAGGNEQAVLSYLVNTGMPLMDGTRDKIKAFVEVDSRHINDVKLTIQEFGVAYIGFQVPVSIYDPVTQLPKQVWDVDPGNSNIEGGHCVVIPKYNEIGPVVISWGKLYQMTWNFFSTYTDEVYAIIDQSWINNIGKTPLNITVNDLEYLMAGIRA